MLTGCRWEYILHGRGVVVLLLWAAVAPVYKTSGEGEGGVECF